MEMTQIINTVGFPIFACMGVTFFLFKLIDRLLIQIDKIITTLNTFNNILISLDNRIEKIERGVYNYE